MVNEIYRITRIIRIITRIIVLLMRTRTRISLQMHLMTYGSSRAAWR